jgi:hypothetical protein
LPASQVAHAATLLAVGRDSRRIDGQAFFPQLPSLPLLRRQLGDLVVEHAVFLAVATGHVEALQGEAVAVELRVAGGAAGLLAVEGELLAKRKHLLLVLSYLTFK